MKIHSYSSKEVKPVEKPAQEHQSQLNNMEDRLEKFDSALNGILGFLKDGQFHPSLPAPGSMPMRNRNPVVPPPMPPYYPYQYPPYPYYRYDEEDRVKLPGFKDVFDDRRPKKRPLNDTGTLESVDEADDLRQAVPYLLFDEFYTLFVRHISPCLFGFDVGNLDRRTVYIRSDLMVALVSLVGALVAGKTSISSLKKLYQEHLNRVVFRGSLVLDMDSDDAISQEYDRYVELCGEESWRKWNLLTRDEKSVEKQKFTEIGLFLDTTAVVIATLYFDDAQLLIGVGLRLALELGMDNVFEQLRIRALPEPRKASSVASQTHAISPTDKLKLWYLLYIADGQQSLISQKKPAFRADFSVKNARKMLFQHRTSIRDHSVVDLGELSLDNVLVMASDGRPSKTLNERLIENTATYNDLRLVSQLEFNQAMVLVESGDALGLLTPKSFGMPWKTNLDLDKWMVHWTCLLTPIHQVGNAWSIKLTLLYYNFARIHINKKGTSSTALEEPEEHDDDLMVALGDRLKSQDMALSAARDMVKSIITDKDITESLRYLPLHIFVMLYYAALVLLESEDPNASIENLVLTRSLVRVMAENLPVDREFGSRLVRSLKSRLEKKQSVLKRMARYALDGGNKIQSLDELSEDEVKRLVGDGGGGKVLAWPGTNHGHP